MCVAIVVGAMALHELKLAQKWQVALGMTAVPFWYITGVLRTRWGLASFWIAMTTYFIAHLLVIWLVFDILLGSFHRVAYVFSIPITMFEGLFLLMAIDGLERRLRRRASEH
jgi:hypothetical protein